MLLPFGISGTEHHTAERGDMAEDQLRHRPSNDLIVGLHAAQRCDLRVSKPHLHHCHSGIPGMLPLLHCHSFHVTHCQQAVQFVLGQQSAHLFHSTGVERADLIGETELGTLHVQIFRVFQVVPHTLPQRRIIKAVSAHLIRQKHSHTLGAAFQAGSHFIGPVTQIIRDPPDMLPGDLTDARLVVQCLMDRADGNARCLCHITDRNLFVHKVTLS